MAGVIVRMGNRPGFHLGVDFEVESYLEYQGQSFVSRFDANSYLYITRAMDYYDAADRGGGDLDRACKNARARFCSSHFLRIGCILRNRRRSWPLPYTGLRRMFPMLKFHQPMAMTPSF